MGLCVSPTPDPGSCSPQVSGDRELQAPSDCPTVAQSRLVPSATESGQGSSAGAPNLVQDVEATQVECLSPRPLILQTSRLASGEKALSSKDFSKDARRRILAPQAKSTLTVYEGKWKILHTWCRSKGLDPIQASTPNIADFLLYLFKQKGLSPITIEGYRTAIAGAIKYATGIDLGTDPALSALIHSFIRLH